MGGMVTSIRDVGHLNALITGVVSFTGHVDMTKNVDVVDLGTHEEGIGAVTVSPARVLAVDV